MSGPESRLCSKQEIMFGQVCVECIMYVSFNYFAHHTKHIHRAVVVAFTSVSGLVYWTQPGLLPMSGHDARPQSKVNNVREWCGNVDGRKFEQLSPYTVHSCSFVRLSGQSLYHIFQVHIRDDKSRTLD